MDSNLSGAAFRSIRALFTAGTVGGLTDRQVLERFTNSDGDGAEVAFASLVERHGPMIMRVCRTVLHDAHEAEDAFQATFLILALKAGSIRGRDSLTSWLYSVAYNVAATARSSAARRRSHELKAGQTRLHAFTEDAGDDLGPMIHEELDRIPERYRAVLVLCCLEGLTQHQAAQHLGWPIGTVQSRLARGRERLRVRLARRGLAPSAAVLVLPLSSEAAQVALSAALMNSTVRLALTIGAARALAIGVVPVAVRNLAMGAIRTMFVNKVVTAGVAALLAAAVIATGAGVYAYQAAKQDPAGARPEEVVKREPPADANSDDGLLTVMGIVRMRDGSPLPGATVRSINGIDETLPVARTDDAGRFRVQGMFEGGGRLHVSSADGSYQAVFKVASVATRTVFSSPLELKVLPALTHRVTVLSQGRPVAGAHVAAVGTDFHVHGVTGEDGKVRLRLPAKERLSELVAWHPTLGATGKRGMENHPREGATELSLLPPAPQTIHVVDVDGHGIGGVELGVGFRPEDCDWIVAKHFKEAHVRTDSGGTAIVPWAPREKLQYVEVDILGSDWKVDETDRKHLAAGITTVHARRERTVQGRLIMPEGADARGILVTGFGFGPANNGDIPSARARRDGTFRFRVPSDHGYVLGIEDLKWASEPWTGMILGKDSAKPAEIAMKVYPATPLTVRVTRGAQRDPVANARLELGAMADVNWTDSTGKKRSGTTGARTWLTTDADGVVRASVGKGKQKLHLNSGAWTEDRTIEVTSEKPVEVEFHRSWNGERRITGRMMFDGEPYVPSPTLVARAWAQRPIPYVPVTFEPVVHPNGTFELKFDAESVSLFFFDRGQQRSGFTERVHGDDDVEISMEAMSATYSGTLLDEKAQPMSGRTLEMSVKTSYGKVVAAQQTDKTGRFRFTDVPCKVPLQFDIRNEGDLPEYYLFEGDRMFNPGEVRENDQLKPRRPGLSSSNVRSSVRLAKSVDDLCRTARSSGMRALVALLGDDSGDAARPRRSPSFL